MTFLSHLRLWTKIYSHYIGTYVQNKSFFWISPATYLQVILPLIHIKLCLSENEKDYLIEKHVNSLISHHAARKNGNLAPSVKSNSMCLNYCFSHVFLLVLKRFTWSFSSATLFWVIFPPQYGWRSRTLGFLIYLPKWVIVQPLATI